MTTQEHETFVYIGMGGEGDNIGQGGLYRRGDATRNGNQSLVVYPTSRKFGHS